MGKQSSSNLSELVTRRKKTELRQRGWALNKNALEVNTFKNIYGGTMPVQRPLVYTAKSQNL